MSGTIDVLVRDRGTSQPITSGVTITATLVSGRIVGTVTATIGGVPLSGASVVATGPQAWSRTTDANGFYASPPLDAGTYQLTVSRSGYASENPVVVVAWGQTVTENVAMDATTGTRDAFGQPFTVHSAWNEPMKDGATYGDITGVISNFTTFALNSDYFTPRIVLALASSPLRTLTGTSEVMLDPDSTAPSPPGTSIQVRVPDGVTVPSSATDSDRHLCIVDPTKTYVYELYKASKDASNNWSGTRLIVNRIRTAGYGVGPWHGGFAYGGSALGGMIRAGEFANGMTHALHATVDQDVLAGGVVWPATSSDGSGTESNVKESTLLAIPQATDLDTLGLTDPIARRMAETMQERGVYILDGHQSGNGVLIFRLEYGARFERPPGSTAQGTPFWVQTQSLMPLLKIVTNNGPTTIGGTGNPIAPYVPELA